MEYNMFSLTIQMSPKLNLFIAFPYLFNPIILNGYFARLVYFVVQ
jgi:hypothetical protein